MYSDSLPLISPLITSERPMVACSIGEVTVFTGATGLRVEGVKCGLGALSVDCSIGTFLDLFSAHRGGFGNVTMAQDYRSRAGYGRCGTAGLSLGQEVFRRLS